MTFIATKTQSMTPDGRRGGLVVGLRRTTTGEVFMLDVGPRRWVVGSENSCDVPIANDPFVSGVHCVLERKPNGVLVVRDRNSRNGTFVDGNPIEGAELRVGSYLSIGRTTLVAVAGAGSATQPRALELLRGRDPVLRRTVEQALKAAQTECSVLILGETGTGKDLLARVVHESSRRNMGPFVAVNCGAIPRELIASELFGHEKGAFTGATDARDGYFVEANGGTLFLDEMGELPIELQAHLLRVLETKSVRRVGSSIERPVNVRIVAATNRTEGLGTESSRLRTDLYHRLATVILALPPLRDRMSDVPELVDALLDELTPDYGRKQLSHAAWISLQKYGWPGNVRELRHAVARAVTLGGDMLEAHDFFPNGLGTRKIPEPPLDLSDDDPLAPYESMMRAAMEQALAQYGSIRAAAAALGMPKSTFADRARQYGILIHRRTRLAPDGRRRMIGVTPAFPQPVAHEVAPTLDPEVTAPREREMSPQPEHEMSAEPDREMTAEPEPDAIGDLAVVAVEACDHVVGDVDHVADFDRIDLDAGVAPEVHVDLDIAIDPSEERTGQMPVIRDSAAQLG